jgi:hypothetical protein
MARNTHTIRTRLRSNVKRSNAVRKSDRMADVFMRHVLRDDRIREARARRTAERAVVNAICDENCTRAEGDRSIRVWRRE